ncbi:Hint domain-containing protein [Jannaschia aquimarina]|uniref:Hedgehog/Intein (Hint) domain-containing protein n=1 Tax=Jannaschia aquimarina TaxID=935700 RepID=A0A0D1ER78_9RHOB|nr:Hint domain-containing protein [Jannaschia aquimarina]KIT18140.1 hypothetical protein jaqu_00740 [Jannaschia aquimarina]SNT30319.1 Hint domain-containing protein [Jannaschia aquimarina]
MSQPRIFAAPSANPETDVAPRPKRVSPDVEPAPRRVPALDAGPEALPCLHAGVRVQTPDGAVLVEVLKAGQRVVLHGGQEATLTNVERFVISRPDWAYRAPTWPIRVPVGALGNTAPLRLSPGMRVLLQGPAVSERCGGEVLVAIRDLVGIGGIARDRPLSDIRYFQLSLPDHALLSVEGAYCETAPAGPRLVRPEAERGAARIAFASMSGRPLLE